jgi:hypothetical protein
MTDRDRLIEIIEEWYEKTPTQYLADYLLANGVIVPPCKVGDMVYVIKSGKIYTETVRGIKQGVCGLYLLISNGENEKYSEPKYFGIDRIGKDVFLTKEQALEKLKELG